MEDLKESYENRIEKVKIEAEGQINSSMAAAQEALSSARNLFESKVRAEQRPRLATSAQSIIGIIRVLVI